MIPWLGGFFFVVVVVAEELVEVPSAIWDMGKGIHSVRRKADLSEGAKQFLQGASLARALCFIKLWAFIIKNEAIHKSNSKE